MTTFTSTTDGNINDGATYGNTSPGVAGTDFPDSDDICVAGGSTTITLNVDYEVRALKITGTIAGGGNTITVNGATSNKPFDNDGTITGDLNVTITNTGIQQDGLLLDAMGTSGNINNLTLNLANGTTANKTVGIASATTIDGNLLITSGTFDTTFDGGASQVLTVTGACDLTGTLTLNSSSVGLGALRCNSGAVLSQNSDGTIELTSATAAAAAGWGDNYSLLNNDGTSDINFGGTMTVSAGNYFKPGTASAGSSIINNLVWNDGHYWIGTLTVGGTMVLNAGKHLQTYGSATGGSRAITVTGAVTINGTLTTYKVSELDLAASFGSLTINSGGTYNATSGTTTLLGNFTDSGTFTHNDGTVSTAGGTAILLLGTSDTAFYDIKSASTGSGVSSFKQYTNKTVEHDMITGSAELQWQLNTNDVVLTLGTDSYASQIDADYFDGAVVANQYVQGASELYPAVFKSTIQFLRYTGHTGQENYMATNAHIKNVDIQKAITTPGDTKTITLEGDCEFAAVNISAGDTLNLNGKRAEFNGAFDLTTSTSAIQMNDAMAVYNNTIDFNGRVPTSNAGTTIIHDPPSTSEKLITSLYFGGTFFAKGAESDVNGYAWGGSSGSGEYPAKIFVGGQLDCQQSIKTGHLQVATGGELRGNDRTLTAEGDFTMSGGLIGKSAFEVTGTTYASGSSILDYSSASVTNITMSGWVKLDDVAAGANNQFILRQNDNFIGLNKAGAIYVGVELQNSAFGYDYPAVITANGTIGDDKWHHVAMTWASGSTLKAYMDGKLIGENTTISADYVRLRQRGAGQHVGVGGLGVPSLAGIVAQTCRWHTTKTAEQIRTEMFQDFSSLSSNTDCIYWYQFDTGTGTTVFDSTSADCDLTSQISNGTATASWAGAGTFIHGTSTLDMTDDGTIGIASGVTQFNNLKVAASGKTTTLAVLAGSSDIRFHGTLTHGGGTATSSGNPAWTMKGTSTVSAGSNWSNWYLAYWESSAAVPAATWKYWLALTDSTLAGDMTCTGYFRPHQSVVNSGEYTITTYNAIFSNTGGLNMGTGSLIFTHAQGLSDSTSSSVFTAGPGATVTGVAGKSTFKSQNNFAIVGKIENLDVTNEELNVMGQVINCTGDIIQQHQTQDSAQQLDYDTADDRDVMLGRDLDKNTELVG